MSVLKGETQDHIHVLAGGSKIPGKKMPLPHVRCKILVKAAQTKISSFSPPPFCYQHCILSTYSTYSVYNMLQPPDLVLLISCLVKYSLLSVDFICGTCLSDA